MSKYAVIFSSHIPDENNLWVGVDILNKIKLHLPGADIYAGVNPSPYVDEWIEVLSESTDFYEITPENLTVKSDASSYQTALRLYHKYNKEYDLVWFVHTQGTKSGLHHAREEHLQKIVVNSNKVIDYFNTNELLGGYTSDYAPAPWIYYEDKPLADKILDKYMDFKYNCFRYITNGTTYVIRGNILNNFLNNCNYDFLSKPITVYDFQTETDLYFFERDFMQIVPRSGFIVESVSYSNHYGIDVTDMYEFYKENLIKWKKDNNLLYD